MTDEPLRSPEELATLDELPIEQVLRILALSTIDNPHGLYRLSDFRRERQRLQTFSSAPDPPILQALSTRRNSQIAWAIRNPNQWDRTPGAPTRYRGKAPRLP